MKINLGYVAVPLSIGHVTSSSLMTYSYYNKLPVEEANEKLNDIILSNLSDLEKILYYNHQNDINFYRMSSSMIPLSTHKEVDFEVYKRYQNQFKKIGDLIKKYQIRVDTHPSNFCVLNSTNPDVVESSINILQDQYNMYQAMKINGKMILHLGSGTYGKKAGINRFIKNFKTLPSFLQEMIILENDDKLYSADDILMVCEVLNIPMVLDYHHHLCNPCEIDIKDLLERIYFTWNKEKLVPKIHFSSPKNKKEFRSHNEYIDLDKFIEFLRILKEQDKDVDIMLEVKGKDEALFRLIRGLKYKNINVSGTTIIL